MATGLIDLMRRLVGLAPADGVTRQFGAIPWRRGEAGIEFLLITSRRTGRWIFPKGGRMALLSAPSVAAQEAYEEAGVEGQISRNVAGSYRGIKVRPTGQVPVEVALYPLEVRVELDDWPEKGQRERRWVGTEEACGLVSDPALVEMIRAVAAEALAETG